jgi:hypothetical protein
VKTTDRKLNGVEGERTLGFFFTFENEWKELFSDENNWSTFTFFNLYYEHAKYAGRYEVELGVFGFLFIFEYIYDDSFTQEIQELIAQQEQEHAVIH